MAHQVAEAERAVAQVAVIPAATLRPVPAHLAPIEQVEGVRYWWFSSLCWELHLNGYS